MWFFGFYYYHGKLNKNSICFSMDSSQFYFLYTMTFFLLWWQTFVFYFISNLVWAAFVFFLCTSIIGARSGSSYLEFPICRSLRQVVEGTHTGRSTSVRMGRPAQRSSKSGFGNLLGGSQPVFSGFGNLLEGSLNRFLFFSFAGFLFFLFLYSFLLQFIYSVSFSFLLLFLFYPFSFLFSSFVSKKFKTSYFLHDFIKKIMFLNFVHNSKFVQRTLQKCSMYF